MSLNPRKLEGGTRLGRFIIKSLIGRGATATVYRADDTGTGQLIALKALHNDPLAEGERAAKRMEREVELTKRIDDPGVCRMYGLHRKKGVLFLTMELIDGVTLESVIQKEGPLDVRRTAQLMREVCRSVESAHDLGIVHRDLKPGNIIIRRNGKPSVLDFGCATGPNVGRVTITGAWVGTLHFVAPEFLKGDKATTLSDVYALGVVLYRCLTKSLPFAGLNYGEIASAKIFRDPTPPSDHVGSIPDGLEAVVLKAMHRHPDQRHQSVTDLAFELEEFAAEETAPSPPKVSPDEPTDPDALGATEPTVPAVPIPRTIAEVMTIPGVDVAMQTEENAPSPAALSAPAPEPNPAAPADDERPVPAIVPKPGAGLPTPQAGVTARPSRGVPSTEKDLRGSAAAADARAQIANALKEEMPGPPTVPEVTDAELKAKHVRLTEALNAHRASKSLVTGDNMTLDGLERTATLAGGQGRWEEAVRGLQLAVEEAERVVVDGPFVQRKIERLDDALRRKSKFHEKLKEYAPKRAQIMKAFRNGSFDEANQALTAAFEAFEV